MRTSADKPEKLNEFYCLNCGCDKLITMGGETQAWVGDKYIVYQCTACWNHWPVLREKVKGTK